MTVQVPHTPEPVAPCLIWGRKDSRISGFVFLSKESSSWKQPTLIENLLCDRFWAKDFMCVISVNLLRGGVGTAFYWRGNGDSER